MSGAVFLLVINFFIAQCFCLSFLAVSARSRNRLAARWFAGAFGIASLATVCEFLVATVPPAKLWAMLAFASMLAGMFMLRLGIGRLYGVKTSPRFLLSLYVAFIALDYAIYDLPRGTLTHALLYQLPFATVLAMSAAAAWQARRKHPVDRALVWLMALTSAHFIAKAFTAVLFGSGQTAGDYLGSRFALFSQSMSAVLIVAAGLMLLCVLVLEALAHEKGNAETDPLSGLLNRRGFDNRVEAVLALPGPHSLVLCDLDQFKAVNDSYGHQGGDAVIAAFGAMLGDLVPSNGLAARFGGEEFAVLLPRTGKDAAVLFAQALRVNRELTLVDGLPSDVRVTASFGVAEIGLQEPLHCAMSRGDAALYDAKNSGRNCVRAADAAGVVVTPMIRGAAAS